MIEAILQLYTLNLIAAGCFATVAVLAFTSALALRKTRGVE